MDHAPYDIGQEIDALRAALKANGITLPSLGVDPLTLAWTGRQPLVALGNCNTETARQLAEVLQRAAGG
ncbi:EAP30/Vps36 family vacuolar-sorting protein [Streptomyces sp. 372A]